MEIVLQATQGQRWVQREMCEEWNPEYTVAKQKHPPKVHAWGCFAMSGVGRLHLFDENLDSALMRTILRDNLIQSAKKLFDNFGREQWYFQQDNDPKHKSNIVQTFIFQSGVTCLDWPPYSPDLNPIEIYGLTSNDEWINTNHGTYLK